jgi:peptidoglycan glycosyltransferase
LSESRPHTNLRGGRPLPAPPLLLVGLLALGLGGAFAGELGGDSMAADAGHQDAGTAQDAAIPPGPGSDAGPSAETPGRAEGEPSLDHLEESEAESAFAPVAAQVPSFATLASLPAVADFLARSHEEEGALVVSVSGARKVLTINPALQRRATELLSHYDVPYGAVAALEPSTGRVLALAEHSADAPGVRGLPLRAICPAASVFKVVSGAALLAAGVSPEEKVCYHGGVRRLNEKLLVDDAQRDGRCLTFTQAMGHSANVIFAKLARRSLDRAKLEKMIERLGFNAQIPFAEPLDVSVARIPGDDFGFANTAAGFGEVFLSPLHGALLAAAVGNKGLWTNPVLFEGEVPKSHRALDEKLAGTLSDMMETCVTGGTARWAFRERGRYALPVRAAGKTGSLANKSPFRDFSWFVGFAPKDDPKIAVAAVVVNGPKWRIRAPYIVRETMRAYLDPPRAKPSAGRQGAKGRRGLAQRGAPPPSQARAP